MHDRWGWDRHVQALASRGYAVLQPNFRGSSGRGRDLLEAGRQQMGRGMIDDIIDATRWAIDNKLGDGKRTCIYGISYGGFAAIAAATQAPELYQCVATQAGLYDMNKTSWEAWLKQFKGRQRWIDEYYGPRSIRESQSPGKMIEHIAAPVMILHGEIDEVVPIDHAHSLEKDLQRAQKSVESHYFPGEAHGFTKIHSRMQVLNLLDQFFSKYIEPAGVNETSDPSAKSAERPPVAPAIDASDTAPSSPS